MTKTPVKHGHVYYTTWTCAVGGSGHFTTWENPQNATFGWLLDLYAFGHEPTFDSPPWGGSSSIWFNQKRLSILVYGITSSFLLVCNMSG